MILAVLNLLTVATLQSAPDAAPVRLEWRGAETKGAPALTDATTPGLLTLSGSNQPGNRLTISGPQYLMIRLDKDLPEVLVYNPTNVTEHSLPPVEDRRVYPPKAFGGIEHAVTVRPATKEEISCYRNLALNPYDVRGAAWLYPHATANSECRNDAVFGARNAIDGSVQNKGHGGWPKQSWGPDKRKDLWWNVEFGRSVDIDKAVITIRADFPHDAYWKTATLEFSDGSKESITLEKKAEAQTFAFSKRSVIWMKITDLVQDKPMGWCGFSEVEVWGTDSTDME